MDFDRRYFIHRNDLLAFAGLNTDQTRRITNALKDNHVELVGDLLATFDDSAEFSKADGVGGATVTAMKNTLAKIGLDFDDEPFDHAAWQAADRSAFPTIAPEEIAQLMVQHAPADSPSAPAIDRRLFITRAQLLEGVAPSLRTRITGALYHNNDDDCIGDILRTGRLYYERLTPNMGKGSFNELTRLLAGFGVTFGDEALQDASYRFDRMTMPTISAEELATMRVAVPEPAPTAEPETPPAPPIPFTPRAPILTESGIDWAYFLTIDQLMGDKTPRVLRKISQWNHCYENEGAYVGDLYVYGSSLTDIRGVGPLVEGKILTALQSLGLRFPADDFERQAWVTLNRATIPAIDAARIDDTAYLATLPQPRDKFYRPPAPPVVPVDELNLTDAQRALLATPEIPVIDPLVEAIMIEAETGVLAANGEHSLERVALALSLLGGAAPRWVLITQSQSNGALLAQNLKIVGAIAADTPANRTALGLAETAEIVHCNQHRQNPGTFSAGRMMATAWFAHDAADGHYLLTDRTETLARLGVKNERPKIVLKSTAGAAGAKPE